MGVSINGVAPKSSILLGFSVINHQFWGTHIYGNLHMAMVAAMDHEGIFDVLQWTYKRLVILRI